jgi:xylulokinase
MEILANVLNVKLSVIDAEGPALGAAALAAAAAGAPFSVTPSVRSTITPDPDFAAHYAAKYEKYKTLYPMLKAFYKEETV